MTPLRRRMLDAMIVRGLSERTQECYVEAVARMARHFNRSPELLSPAEIEAYMLHLIKDRHLSYSSVNHAASASRFLFEKVLGRKTEGHLRPPMARVPQKQPELLSRQEIACLFANCPPRPTAWCWSNDLCHRPACDRRSAAYGCKTSTAPPTACVYELRAGKGGHDRYSATWRQPAEPTAQLLQRLHAVHRRNPAILIGGCFPTSALMRKSFMLTTFQRAYHKAPAQRGHHQTGRHPHPAPLLCHAPARRRRGPVHHQPTAWSRPHQHHQSLPAPDQPAVSPTQGR
jgi:integrase/recombinase XerD